MADGDRDDELKTMIREFRASVSDGFARVEARLDALDGRMDGLEGRMDGLEGRMDGLEGRMDRLERSLEDHRHETRQRFQTMEIAFFNSFRDLHDSFDARIRRLEDRDAAS